MNRDNAVSIDSSFMKSVNLSVFLSIGLLDFCLTAGYIVEYLKGGKTLSFVLTFIAILLVPLLISIYMYKRDTHSINLKWVTFIGYLFVYAFAMFASQRVLIFVYIFPIISVYLLYFDLRFMVFATSSVMLLNIVRIVVSATLWGLNDKSTTTEYTIQFVAVALYSSSLIIATRMSNRNNSIKMENIKREKEKQEQLLAEVLKTAKVLDTNSSEVFGIVNDLTTSSESVARAVNEIAQGTASSAENIEVQSSLTSEIQNLIVNTAELSKKMEGISKETSIVTSKGLEIIKSLSQKANTVNESNSKVYELMQSLKEKSNEIQNITDIITSISEQTNLLSLNASIESARAGEAGRGFAVVADEIRKLAEQSKTSANDISNIIKQLQEGAAKSVEATNILKQVSGEQNQLITQTNDVFSEINIKVSEVSNKIDDVNSRIEDVLNANNKIVESISNISALAEETMANAQEATAMSSEHISQTSTAKKYVEMLIETSKEMKKYSS